MPNPAGWLFDILGVRSITDALASVLPTRQTLRFLGSVSCADNTTLGTTDITVGAVATKYSFLNLTGNLSPTNIAILPAGYYVCVVELYLHTTGTSGSITAALEWTDRAGFGHAVSTVQDRGSIALVVGNAYSLPISVDGVHNVTHQVTGISTAGALQYDLHYTFTAQ